MELQLLIAFMQARGDDFMEFICEVDLGNHKVPSDWHKALAVLRKNYVTSMVIQAFADCMRHKIVIVTENRVGKTEIDKR